MPYKVEGKQGEFQYLDTFNGRMAYYACIECGKVRLVRIRKGKPESVRCRKCSNRRHSGFWANHYVMKGKNNPRWKGGEFYTSHGYIMVQLKPDNPFYSMVNKNGYIYQHRYLMAKHLNRPLEKHEVVHHKNGIRDDNQIENLALLSNGSHNTILNREIKLLKWRIKELEERCCVLEGSKVGKCHIE